MKARCVDCGAEVLHGQLHEMRVRKGEKAWIERRCRECADKLAWALWPEDYGPCPYQRHAAGRC
jgi:hypothetical protein